MNSAVQAGERIDTVLQAPVAFADSTADQESPRLRGIKPKITKTAEKKTGSPRLRRSTGSTDAKPEKVSPILIYAVLVLGPC